MFITDPSDLRKVKVGPAAVILDVVAAPLYTEVSVNG
jgi:hypothetical protein